jgi:DNA-binding transcriptional LysR family regulator
MATQPVGVGLIGAGRIGSFHGESLARRFVDADLLQTVWKPFAIVYLLSEHARVHFSLHGHFRFSLEVHPLFLSLSSRPAAQLVKGGLGVSLLPRLLVQNAIGDGQITAFETNLPVQPSRMFAAYRVAEGSAFVQEIVSLGHEVMLQSQLIEPSTS